jgi:hypothetical protein
VQKAGKRREGHHGARPPRRTAFLDGGVLLLEVRRHAKPTRRVPPTLGHRLYTRHQPTQCPVAPVARVDRALQSWDCCPVRRKSLSAPTQRAPASVEPVVCQSGDDAVADASCVFLAVGALQRQWCRTGTGRHGRRSMERVATSVCIGRQCCARRAPEGCRTSAADFLPQHDARRVRRLFGKGLLHAKAREECAG